MSEWQPIETVPDDARYIIGAWLDGQRWRAAQVFNEYGDWVDVRSDMIHEPTHWMPLPPEDP